MEALGTLSGGIAHDFNNILAAIIGFTDLVAGHTDKGSKDAARLKRVMDAGIRGRELVRQMLTFSRKTEQERKLLHLDDIVRETVKLIRASVPATIDIRVDVSDGSDLIFADPTQIQQVLMNLCTNAAYAMRESGGTLDIRLSYHSVFPSNGDPHGIAPGPYVVLSVAIRASACPPTSSTKYSIPSSPRKDSGKEPDSAFPWFTASWSSTTAMLP
jgi:two-component system, cell cycle sensor histidine kinase and response regulator CckA